MLPVFQIVFSVPVISRIESLGGGRMGGGGGRWEAEGGLKQPFRLKQHCCGFSMGPEQSNPEGVPRLLLGEDWHPMQSY